MTVWTVVVAGLYSRPAGRRWPVLALDLLIAMVAVDLPRLLDDPDRIVAGAQTLPVVWAAAPVLAFAIKGGWPAGLGAAAAVSAADLLHRGALTVPTANNIVLLMLAGVVVGYTVDLARRGETALTEALAVEAATRERDRLSRDIHDGVLQVLALVGRRGQEAGGEAAEIGRLAAEQELALRALVGSSPQVVAGRGRPAGAAVGVRLGVGDGVHPRDPGRARRRPGPRGVCRGRCRAGERRRARRAGRPRLGAAGGRGPRPGGERAGRRPRLRPARGSRRPATRAGSAWRRRSVAGSATWAGR